MRTWTALRRATPALAMALGLVSPRDAGAQPAPTGSGVFLYLRCNATGWGIDASTRLRPTADPDVFELTYEVEAPWMLSAGDDCVVTETAVEDTWTASTVSYGADHPITLGIDTRTRLVLRNDPATANFKVRYAHAGVHHARLHRSERALVLRQDGPITEGGEAWSSPGTLTVDRSGHLYRSLYSPTPSFARVSRDDGRDLWSLTGSAFYVDPACATADRLVVRGPHGVLAIDPESGRTLWNNDLDGALQRDTAVSISCPATHNFVAVLFGDPTPTLAVLDAAAGSTRWAAPSDPFATISVVTADTILTRAYQAMGHRVQAFDVARGAILWTATSEAWAALFASPAGQVYASSTNEVRQIDARTGAERFRVASTNSFPWLTFEAGGTFLRDVDRIVKLDPASGQALWTHDLRSPLDPYPSSTVLPSGRIVVTRHGQGLGTAETTLLDGASGQVVWTQTSASTAVWIEEDREGRLFARGERTLSRVDPSDGRNLWTYEHPREPTAQPHTSGGLGFIADSDGARVYITYRAPGYRYPPMSLLGLDAASGERRFQFDDTGNIQVLGRDEQRIYVQTGYFSTVLRALFR